MFILYISLTAFILYRIIYNKKEGFFVRVYKIENCENTVKLQNLIVDYIIIIFAITIVLFHYFADFFFNTTTFMIYILINFIVFRLLFVYLIKKHYNKILTVFDNFRKKKS